MSHLTIFANAKTLLMYVIDRQISTMNNSNWVISVS